MAPRKRTQPPVSEESGGLWNVRGFCSNRVQSTLFVVITSIIFLSIPYATTDDPSGHKSPIAELSPAPVLSYACVVESGPYVKSSRTMSTVMNNHGNLNIRKERTLVTRNSSVLIATVDEVPVLRWFNHAPAPEVCAAGVRIVVEQDVLYFEVGHIASNFPLDDHVNAPKW